MLIMRSMMANTGVPRYFLLISFLVGPGLSYFIIPCGVDCEYISEESLLSCSGRSLTCVPKPCCMERTRFVDLSHNNLTTIRPRAFQSFLNLNSLDLKRNSINSLSPRAFQGLRYLQTLDLKDNRLSTLQAGVFEGLLNLRSLTLSKNMISDIQPGTFRLLPNLKNLKLHHNLLQVIYPDTFAQLVELVSLDLDSNLIHTTYQGSFSTLLNLQSLSLVNNNIASLPEFLSTLTELEQLHLKGNPLYCDCSLEFLRRWYNEHGEESYRKSGECSQPSRLDGLLLATLKTEQLCRTSEESMSYSYTSYEEESYISPVEEVQDRATSSIWTERNSYSNQITETTTVTSLTDQVRVVTTSSGLHEHSRNEAMSQANHENEVTPDVTGTSSNTKSLVQTETSTSSSSPYTIIRAESFESLTLQPAPETQAESLDGYATERSQSKLIPKSDGIVPTLPSETVALRKLPETYTVLGDWLSGPSATTTDEVSTKRITNLPDTTTPLASNRNTKGAHFGHFNISTANVVNNSTLRKGINGRSDTRVYAQDGGTKSTNDSANPAVDNVDVYAPRKAPLRGRFTPNYETSFEERPLPSQVADESYLEETTFKTEQHSNLEGEVTTESLYNDSLQTDSVQTTLLDESIILECPMAVPAPLMNYLSYYDTKWLSPSGQWIEEHMERFSFTGDGGLSILHTRSSDHGTYRCVRAQLLGPPMVASVRLRVSCPCLMIPEMTYFTKQPVMMASTSMMPPHGNDMSNNDVRGRGLRNEDYEGSCNRMPIVVAVLMTFQVTVALCILTFCGILNWRSSRKSKTDKIPRPESILETRPLSGVNYYDHGEVPNTTRMRTDIPTIVYESTRREKPEETHENNSESDSALSSSGSQRNSSVGTTDVYVNAQHNSLRRDTQTYADLDPNSRSRHDTYSSLHLQEQEDSE